jgi:hypothetical protein
LPSYVAKRDAGASLAAFPRWSVGTITVTSVLSRDELNSYNFFVPVSWSNPPVIILFLESKLCEGNTRMKDDLLFL